MQNLYSRFNRSFIVIFLLFSSTAFLKSQTINDGCMRIRPYVLNTWVQEFEDPFADDEAAFNWYSADNANLDLQGWRSDYGFMYLTGSNFIGWRTIFEGGDDQIGPHPVYNLFDQTYGTVGTNVVAATPQFLQIRGSYTGDDCGSANGCTTGLLNCFGDDDDYCYDDVLTSTLNYRFSPPNQTTSTVDVFTNNHGGNLSLGGGSNYGARVAVNWSSPIPSGVTANTFGVCSGGSAILTALGGAVFGGTYSWYTSGGTFLGTGTSITVSPTVTTTYRCYCRNGGIDGLCFVDITITASASPISNNIITPSPLLGPFCASGDPGLITGGAPTVSLPAWSYDWQTSTNGGASWTTVFTGTSAALPYQYNPGVTSQTLLVRRVIYSGGCDNSSNILTYEVQQAVAGNTIAADQTLCGTGTPAPLAGSIATGGSGTYTYQWQSASALAGPYADIFGANGQGYSPGVISSTTYFKRVVTAGVCPANTSSAIAVTILPPIAGNSISSNQSFCGSGDPALLSASGVLTGGNGIYTYNWQESTDGGNNWSLVAGAIGATYDPPALSQTTIYRRGVYSGQCFNYSPFVTITIYSPINNNSISSDQNSCGSFTATALIGTSPGGGSGSYVFQWQNSFNGGLSWSNIGGANSGNYSPGVIASTTLFRRVVTAGPCSDTSNSVTINITPAITANTIGNNQTFCSSGDPAILSGAVPSGGTGSFGYQWEESTNGGVSWTPVLGANGLTFDPPATSSTIQYHRVATSGACSSNSNTVTMLVLALPQVTQVTHTNVLCFGESNGTITVSGTSTNGAAYYSVDSGSVYQASGIFSGLPIGSYYVYVSDDSGCVNTYAGNPEVITQPQILDHTTVVTQASCASVFDASISVTATGGSIPYTYALNGGPSQFGNVFSGLSSGNYTVQVFDSKGCSDTTHVFIDTLYGVYGSVVSQTDVSCYGGVDGTVTVQLTGGVLPYSYSINGVIFQNNPVFNGLASGNYIVTLRDSKGCTDFVTVTIAQPNQMVAFIDSVQNILCNGSNSGGIFITVTGGNGGNTFLWSNGATTEDITGLSAGTYNVAVTDSKGCTASAGATIAQPLPLFVNVASYQNLLCNSDSSGYVDITANGGVPPYSFVWNNGETTEDITNLPIGTYDITVTDANGCIGNQSQVIIQPAALTSTITPTDISCAGVAGGSVDLSVSGGTLTYSYLWNNGATTQDLLNVSGGNYSVVVYDANGCSITNSTTVAEPLPISIATTITNVLCNGLATGAINLTVTGGAGNYNYSWSNGFVSQDISGLIAGPYSVTITDGNNCTASVSATVTQPAGIVLNATPTNVGCAGGNNGAIDITVQGGVFPYSYLWSNNAITEDISGLSGGTYDVTITDNNLCTVTDSYTISEPAAITSSITNTNVSCNGSSDGTADLSVTGGTSPYTYLWSNFLGSQDVTGLHGGLYYVIITDANGCERRDSVLISEPAVLSLSTTVTSISCYNSNDGAIDVTVNGGTPNYAYLWSNGAQTEDLNGLQNGIYAVTVTDANGCTATTSVTIINPSIITANFIVHDPLCFGSNDGIVDLIPSGGTPGYTYLWSTGDNTEDISGIGGGTFIVTITDSKGCTRIDSASAVEPQPLVTSGVIKNVTCAGNSDGFIDITAYGGTLPYSYTWSTQQSTEDVFNLPGGNYFVSVTDANACQVASLYIIREPLPLTTSIVSSNVSCFGQKTGTVAVIPAGGTTPYYYLWNNFATDSALTGLDAGRYTVQLIDSNGCLTYDTAFVTEPSQIAIAGNVTDVVCFGANTGSVALTVTGGTPTYTFAWTGGSSTQDLLNATAGTYTVTVTDANTCTLASTFNISQGAKIVTNLAGYNPICNGGTTGAVSAIVIGGSGPYTYLWSTTPIQTGVAISGIKAGDYYLTVTDALNCTTTDSITLIEPQPIVVLTNATGAKCFNTATGVVSTTVTGGNGPYTFLLNGVAQDTGVFSNLAPGNYLILVTDVNGCQGNASFTVSSPSELSVDLGVTQQVILTGMNTQLVANATSTSPIIHYFWSPDSVVDYSICSDPSNCSNPLVAPLTTTTFTVMVMNSDSCYASDTVTVIVLNQPSAFIATAFTPNDDQLNDRFEFDILGASNIEVNIFNRWGQRVYFNPAQANGINNQNGWDGKVDGKLAPFDTYVYQMKVTYWDNATKDFTGTVTLMK